MANEARGSEKYTEKGEAALASGRLRVARVTAGFHSAFEAAEEFGWNRHTYTSHENGNRNFSLSRATVYADAFNVSAGWILAGVGDGPTAMSRRARQSSAASAPGGDVMGAARRLHEMLPLTAECRGIVYTLLDLMEMDGGPIRAQYDILALRMGMSRADLDPTLKSLDRHGIIKITDDGRIDSKLRGSK